MDYKICNSKERRKLLNEIGKMDFVLKDLNLYLDTHPYDQQAMELFQKYNDKKQEMTKEYTQAYGPLNLNTPDSNTREWRWALQDWPWEGGYQ